MCCCPSPARHDKLFHTQKIGKTDFIIHVKLKLLLSLLCFNCVWLFIVLLQGKDVQTSTLQPFALTRGFPLAVVGLHSQHLLETSGPHRCRRADAMVGGLAAGLASLPCAAPGSSARGQGWASLKPPGGNLPLLRKHCSGAELEVKRVGGGDQLCCRVKQPWLGRCAFFTHCITPASRFCLEEPEHPR